MFLTFLLALASSFTSTEAPARAHARQKTRGTLTEVHFFRADDHTRAIATYSITAPVVGSTTTHGSYGRLRFGPRDLAKAERLRAGIGDARVIREGDDVTVFAINHATGYAGMTTVKVPDYADATARVTDLVEIVGDIKLFPPEIELTVERQLKAAGVAAATMPSKIRGGGAATTNDEWLKIGSRWRVRLAAARNDDYVDGGSTARAPGSPIRSSWGDGRTTADILSADAGALETDTSDAGFIDGGRAVQQGVTALVDEGTRGAPLERLCSELDENATPREYLDCLNDETTLTDVPAGVPPIAGRMVHLSGAASTDQLFHIEGGAHEQALHVARKTTTSTTLPIQTGLHLLHVVGRPLFGNADVDGDGELSQTEREAGSDCSDVTNTDGSTSRRCAARITPSDAVLVAGAPDFRDDVTLRGFPKQAVAVKALYDARLQAEASGPARKVASYDTTREHRFRVLSIEHPETSMSNGDDKEVIAESDVDGRLEEGLDAVTLALGLVDMGRLEDSDRDDLSHVGDYEVRLGTDETGMDCNVSTVSAGAGTYALTGSCEGASLDEVISAADVLYLEMFLSGNADNVLYRHNLYGTKTRRDFVVAGSEFTARKSTKDVDPNTFAIKQEARAPTAKLNQALFFIDPDRLTSGIVRVCLDDKCAAANTKLKEFNVTAYSPTSGFTIEPRDVPGEVDQPVEAQQFYPADRSQWFQLMLPADMSTMPGTDKGKRFFVQYAPTSSPTSPTVPEPTSLAFRVGEGRFESRAANPAGQLSEGGIVLSDGRLVRNYTDLVLPDLGVTCAFERTYDNGRNEPSPLGTGWSHNFEGSIYESKPGTYQVVLGGQGYDFPSCTVVRNASKHVTEVKDCKNDKAHAGKLDVTVTPHATDPAQYEDWTATFTDDAGAVYTFDREAANSSGPGRRRLLLTEIDDGITDKPLELEYTNADDHVDEVKRSGSWSLTFHYAEVPEGTTSSRLPIPISTTRQSIPRLTRVETDAATIEFDHDLDDGAACGPPTQQKPSVRYGRLLRVCRKTRPMNDDGSVGPLTRDELWTYAYAAVPATLVGAYDRFAAGNELVSEQLELPLSSSPVVHRADWDRGFIGPHVYAHMSQSPFETVTRGNFPGRHVEVNFAGSAVTRAVTLLDGTVGVVQLNKYGNVTKLTNAEGTATAAWLSDDDSQLVAPDRTTGPSGDAVQHSYDGERLQKTQVTAVPHPGRTAGYGPGTTTEVLTRHTRTNTPTSVKHTAGGTPVTFTSTVHATGKVLSQSVAGLEHEAEAMTVDGNAVMQTSTSPGYTTNATAPDATWHLPTSITTTCSACVADDVTRTTNITYDSLGRPWRVEIVETDRKVTTTRDALGRVTSEKFEQDPNETWNTTYELNTGSGTRTIRRRLASEPAAVFTTTIDAQDRVTSTRDPLGRGEDYTYDGNTQRVLKVERVGGGEKKLAVEYTYERGVLVSSTEHDLNGAFTTTEYDDFGRPIAVTVDSERTTTTYDPAYGYETEICAGTSGTTCKHRYTITHDHAARKVTTSSDGLHIEQTTDAALRPLKTTTRARSGGRVHLSTEMAYDVDGRARLQTEWVASRGTAELLHVQALTYGDTKGNRFIVAADTVQGPVIASQIGTTTTDLDDRGRPTTIQEEGAYFRRPTTTTYDYSAEVHRVLKTAKTTTSPKVASVTTDVDDFDRVVRRENAQETRTFDGWQTFPTTTSTYDYRGGRLVRETRTSGRNTSQIDRVIDGAGRALSEVVSIGGATTSFGTRTYDVAGLIGSNDFVTRLNNQGETYLVELGRKSWTRDAAGRELSFTLNSDVEPSDNTVLFTAWDDDRLSADLYDVPVADGAVAVGSVAYDGRQELIERDVFEFLVDEVGPSEGATVYTDRDALSRTQAVRTVGVGEQPRRDTSGRIISERAGTKQVVIYGINTGSGTAIEALDINVSAPFSASYCDLLLTTNDVHERVDEQLRATTKEDRRVLAESFGLNPQDWPCEMRLLVDYGRVESVRHNPNSLENDIFVNVFIAPKVFSAGLLAVRGALTAAGGIARGVLSAVSSAASRFARPTAVAPSVTILDASAIRFSQSNVRNVLPEIVQSMRAKGWRGAPIDVVRMADGGLVAVDNTRLAAASLTKTPVRAVIRGFGEAFPVARAGGNLQGATWGEAIMNRIAGQKPRWRMLYPHGAPFTGVHPSMPGFSP